MIFVCFVLFKGSLYQKGNQMIREDVDIIYEAKSLQMQLQISLQSPREKTEHFYGTEKGKEEENKQRWRQV